jgi:hypothetical protein
MVGIQEKRNAGKPEGKRLLRTLRNRWVYNIKMHVEEIR